MTQEQGSRPSPDSAGRRGQDRAGRYSQQQAGAFEAAAAHGRPFPGALRAQQSGPAQQSGSGQGGAGQQAGAVPQSGAGQQSGGGPSAPGRSGGRSGGRAPAPVAPDPRGGDGPEYSSDGDQENGWFLPAPADLAEYERIHPGMADRILALAENEARFRWGADPEVAAPADRTGQLSALAIIVLFFAAAVYLIGSGKQVAGCILGVVDLVALIFVFVTTGRLGRR